MSTPETIFENLINRYPVLRECAEEISRAYIALKACFIAGGKLLLCGNGGSAADCEHIAGELMKGFLLKRPVPQAFRESPELDGEGELLQRALPAISLTCHAALSTAFANDVAADMVFAQQTYALGQPGDVLLGISTSGNAANVCRALRVANAAGLVTIGLTGKNGGKMNALCKHVIHAPTEETYLIQELHLPIYHALCAMLEADFFAE